MSKPRIDGDAELGAYIRQLRKEHGETQTQLANAIGFYGDEAYRMVEKYEQGKTFPPGKRLMDIAHHYGVSVYDLVCHSNALMLKVEYGLAEDTMKIMTKARKKEYEEMENFFSAVGIDVRRVDVTEEQFLTVDYVDICAPSGYEPVSYHEYCSIREAIKTFIDSKLLPELTLSKENDRFNKLEQRRERGNDDLYAMIDEIQSAMKIKETDSEEED